MTKQKCSGLDSLLKDIRFIHELVYGRYRFDRKYYVFVFLTTLLKNNNILGEE
jgi:hypothetical protein